MADKKSEYNFGGHKFDAELYLQNLRDNAEGFLSSKTDWTPEQKEEWKHSYTNFTNALQEDIKNGSGRFSTDEFGSIIDNKGEFSNTDSDNFYYDNNGKQISGEEYDKLKKKKQGKYKAFAANRQFANYANQIGKGLRDALKAKEGTVDSSEGFDYTKNGFDAYWQKKYNPAGTANDMQPYWAKDKDGEYTNRVSETIADLDDYMSKQEMNDDVKAAYQNYRDVLSQYNPTDKNFNLDTWKNNLVLASNRAGLTNWNNGYFNIGAKAAADNSSASKTFDINNDQDVIDRYNLADQIAAHPEQRDHIIALARRQYNQESQKYDEEYNAAIKQDQDAKNNKIWETYLANEGRGYGDVTKRKNIKWYGNGRYGSNTATIYQSKAGREALTKLQQALAKTHWDSDAEGLFTPLKTTLSNGTTLNTVGEHLAYYLPMLEKMGAKFDDNFEEAADNEGHKLWRVKNSKNKAGQYLYIWNKAKGLLGAYRDVPFTVKKAEVTKAFYGVKIQSKEQRDAAKEKENQEIINNPTTPEDKKKQIVGQRKPGDTEFTATDIARITSAGMDVASALSAFIPVYGTAVSAGTGLASTFTNLGADVNDDSLSKWDVAKNFGTNLAMDVVGLVPGFGTAGKAGKITRTLVKYVPRILTALSAANALSPESRASWAKLASNESLTVKDWQNIAAGCSALAGVTRGVVGHVKASAMAKGTKTKDFNITASDGKQYKVTAEQLETLKKQKSLEDINKEFKKIHPDAELSSFFRNGKWQQLRHLHFNNPQVKSVYDFSRLNNPGIFSDANIWQVARKGNLHGMDIDIKNPYKNSLLKPTNTPTNSNTAPTSGGTTPKSPSFSKEDLQEIKKQTQGLQSEWKNANLDEIKNAKDKAKAAAKNAQNATDPSEKKHWADQAKRWRLSYRNGQTEYNRLRKLVDNKGNLTFDVGTGSNKHQIKVAWSDILKKYGIKYKQGGSIRKFQAGGQPNGNPYASLLGFGEYSKDAYTASYGGNQVGMQTNGIYGDPYTSQGAGTGKGRIQTDKQYSTFTADEREKAKSIENQNLYKQYTEALVKSANDYLNTPEAERSIKWNKDNNEFLYWAEQFDNQYKNTADKARFFSAPGKLNGSWTTSNNDSYNQPAGKQNSVEERIRALRNDQQLARAHDDREKQGKRYFWEQDGVQHWVDAANIDKIDSDKFDINEFSSDVDDNGTYWTNYKITAKSKADPEGDTANKKNLGQNQGLQEPDLIAKWGIPRAMAADATNRAVTDKLKKQPLLLDPQEDHRYIQSDLDAEMNGIADAAQWYRYAANPITSDGDTQTALGLEAVGKANDAITQNKQTSNQRQRTMAEQAWQQEVANHTNRHNTAMTNRQSIYDTKNANNSLEAAYDNQKFTIWDTLAQEKEYKEKSDYEQLRAKYDQFAQQDITNSIKYGMLGLNYKAYGMTDADAKLWDSVYNTGTETLENIQKDPAKMKQWNRILSITRQMQNDMLAQHYHIPQSPYHTVRTASYSPTITTSVTTQKQGGCLNVKKVRAAAKGEKLAAAQLKAQTADADRFYKTTKDTIDRMYDAIDRLTNYSSTKKKRKKKS